MILDQLLDLTVIEGVNQLAKENGLGVYYMGLTHGYVFRVPQSYLDMINKDYGYTYLTIQEIKEPVYMFDIYYNEGCHLNDIQKMFKNRIILNDHYNGLSADATILGCSKGQGLQAILEKLAINFENTYAFGDGMNNLCMFEVV